MQYLQLQRHSDYKSSSKFKLKGFLKGVRISIGYLTNDKGKKVQHFRTICGVGNTPKLSTFSLTDPVKGTTRKVNVEQFFAESKSNGSHELG